MAFYRPIALYIHVPWCIKKCPYCDFNSHTLSGEIQEKHYLSALCLDLAWEKNKNIEPMQITSIFIGGGTPSLLSPNFYEKLLTYLHQQFAFAENIEITIEANPGTTDNKSIDAFFQLGINRISFGVQSFNNPLLDALGRIHTADQAISAIKQAQHAGYTKINIDLMFGLPGQTLDTAARDIEQALTCNPGHISYYQLTIEPNTWFHYCPPVLPVDSVIWEMQEQLQQRLSANNYRQYEVSAYSEAQPCLHNLNYWQFGDYLGVGAGAHGKITRKNTLQRTSKRKQPNDYMKYAGTDANIAQQLEPDADNIMLEFMMNALRLKSGFSLSLFTQQTGLKSTMISPVIKQCEKNGLLLCKNNQVMTTDKGWNYLDDILSYFIP